MANVERQDSFNDVLRKQNPEAAELFTKLERLGAAANTDLAAWAAGDMSDPVYQQLRRQHQATCSDIHQRLTRILKGQPIPDQMRRPLEWGERAATAEYPCHPCAELFPRMNERDFAELVVDIRTRGLQQPIVIDGALLLDGRHRLAACKEAKIAPRFVEFSSLGLGPTCTAEQLIWSANMHRRHLSADQRAVIAQAWKARIALEGKQRQRDAGGDQKSPKAQQKSLGANSPQAIQPETLPRPPQPLAPGEVLSSTEKMERVLRETAPKRAPKTVEKLAAAAKVSEHKIRLADKIAAQQPELVDRVRQGEITLAAAAKQATPPVVIVKATPSQAADADFARLGRNIQETMARFRGSQQRDYLLQLQKRCRLFFGEMLK